MPFNLEDHLAREHKRTAFSQYLREIVYGGNDGIVTTFAVVAGFAGAAKDPATSSIPIMAVLLFGLANLFADGLSMSLGSFLSLRSDQAVYRSEKAREHHEILHEPEKEYEETIEILHRKGFTTAQATSIAKLYRSNTSYWTEFMMKDELEMPNPEGEHPLFAALATFSSFIFFGSIPLIPYVFSVHFDTFQFSILSTGIALVLLGWLRSTVSQQNVLHGIAETLLIGAVAASAAFAVGSFFRI